jgi:hypothetical protein
MLLPTGFPRPCTELHGHCKRTTENPPQRNKCGADCKGHVGDSPAANQRTRQEDAMADRKQCRRNIICSLVVTMGAEDLAGTRDVEYRYEPLAVSAVPPPLSPTTSITKVTEFQY